jgi:RNA polymerase sigma-70 factor, ECF subfamily
MGRQDVTQRFASNGTRFLPAARAGTAEATPDDAAAEDAAAEDAAPSDWVAALHAPGPERDRALGQLHGLMVRAARHQVRRMRGMLPASGSETLDELATAAADGALTALLGKLDTFEGRSRFTTWAYKFAILEAATEVRRRAWSGREVSLDVDDRWSDPDPGPEQLALARDLADAVRLALQEALTPHQRGIAVALLVDDVPIDVLAERLGTTRGALYKTLHDARRRIRAHLTAAGYLSPVAPQAGA